MVEYDEDRELTQYIWDHFYLLMTEFERRVGLAIIGRAKATAMGAAETSMIQRRWGQVGVPEIDTALADGPEAFRRRVRDRVLSERGAEVFINRCSRCGRVVRTPQARQCFWCGFDWHNAGAAT